MIAGFVGCETSTEDVVTLSKIEVTKQALKSEYFVGEELDLSGLEITARYSDGTKSVVDGWSARGYDRTKTGTQEIIVSYSEEDVLKEICFNVSVRKRLASLKKIEITNPASRTEFFAGEKFDYSGLEITATYSDDTSIVVKDFMVTGYDGTKTGTQTITVSYAENDVEKKACYTVDVNKRLASLEKIEIVTKPKTDFFVGDEIVLTGLLLAATYSDGAKAFVTGWKAFGYDKTKIGDQEIKVSYREEGITKETCYKVSVKEPSLEKIEITAKPKTKYYISDELDLTGLVVTAMYDDGFSEDVTDKTTLSGFDSGDVSESQTLTAFYEGKTATFAVEICWKYKFHDTVTVLSGSTSGSFGEEAATYVEFGDFPQDVVPENDVESLSLDEDSDTTIKRGYLRFVLGADGNYYVKCIENGYSVTQDQELFCILNYATDDSKVGIGGTTYRWFKVMPIKWRVADENYKDSEGNVRGNLLLAETALEGLFYYEDRDRHAVEADNVYASNWMHSQIRAYLNGLVYWGKNSEEKKWKGKGFLQTAFGNTARESIMSSVLDNSAESTTDVSGEISKQSSFYVCNATEDKIFCQAYMK